MVLHPLEIVGSTMISCQEYEIVTLAHLSIECFQQSGYILVEFEISLIGMLTTCAPLMTYHIGLRITDT